MDCHELCEGGTGGGDSGPFLVWMFIEAKEDSNPVGLDWTGRGGGGGGGEDAVDWDSRRCVSSSEANLSRSAVRSDTKDLTLRRRIVVSSVSSL